MYRIYETHDPDIDELSGDGFWSCWAERILELEKIGASLTLLFYRRLIWLNITLHKVFAAFVFKFNKLDNFDGNKRWQATMAHCTVLDCSPCGFFAARESWQLQTPTLTQSWTSKGLPLRRSTDCGPSFGQRAQALLSLLSQTESGAPRANHDSAFAAGARGVNAHLLRSQVEPGAANSLASWPWWPPSDLGRCAKLANTWSSQWSSHQSNWIQLNPTLQASFTELHPLSGVRTFWCHCLLESQTGRRCHPPRWHRRPPHPAPRRTSICPGSPLGTLAMEDSLPDSVDA